MKKSIRFFLMSVLLLGAYLLSACSGASSQSGVPSGGKPQAEEVAFTGTVQSVSASEITVSGQTVGIDAKTLLDPNIKVGDIVKVEAQVSETGAVIALKIETSGADNTNSNSSNANDANANGDNTNTNTNDNTNASNDNINSNDNGNGVGGVGQEIFGVVEAITADTVTVNGVTYNFTSSTEFKGAIAAGDQVKLHVIVNADGTFTVREIGKTDGTTIGNDNSNVNGDDNGNDDNQNSNNNTNGNTNGDDNNSNGGSNKNGNGTVDNRTERVN